jgi:hypothetical protein
MLKNYFTTAIRHFWKQKGYTLLNVLVCDAAVAGRFCL